MKQHHDIEIFSANCSLCKHVTDTMEIGRCDGCSQKVYDINNMNEDLKVKMRDYDVTSVPTIIIDGKIKVIGVPNFPWVCSEDLYRFLEKNYSL